MKKVLVLLVAMVLMMTSVAFADTVPSKIPDDMTSMTAVDENGNAVEGTLEMETSEEAKEEVNAELKKLQEAESVSEYFGDVVDENGNSVDLNELLGVKDGEELSVDEFFALNVDGFSDACGDVVCTMEFATPYETGAEVAVLVGYEGENGMAWTALQGTGVNGSIQMTFPEDLLLNAQGKTTMIAIVNIVNEEQSEK